jgi:hypothetical protein
VGDATGSVEVAVTPEGTSWRLAVRFLSPVAAERVMRTGTCEEAAQAALLFVRLGARGQTPPRTPRRSAEHPAASPPPPEPAEPESLVPSVLLGVSALAQQGPLPSLVSRLGVTVGLEWAGAWQGLLSLRAGGRTLVPGGPTPDARVVVQPLVGGQLSMCWQPRTGRFAGGPCAVVGAEAWQVGSENVARPRIATGVLVGAGLEARGAVQLWQGLSLIAALGGRVALVRPSVFFRDSGTVFEAGAFSAEGEVGLRWAW